MPHFLPSVNNPEQRSSGRLAARGPHALREFTRSIFRRSEMQNRRVAVVLFRSNLSRGVRRGGSQWRRLSPVRSIRGGVRESNAHLRRQVRSRATEDLRSWNATNRPWPTWNFTCARCDAHLHVVANAASVSERKTGILDYGVWLEAEVCSDLICSCLTNNFFIL